MGPLVPPAIPGDPEPRRRLFSGGRSLREHTVHGTLINAAFNVGLAVLGGFRHFLIAIFLTAADYGLWGLIYASVTAVLWLKDIGLGDRFVQQDEPDQQVAFEKAFTVNLIWTAGFCALAAIAVPLLAMLYGHDEIVVPGLVLVAGVLATALHSPFWVFYREMRFVKQRTLESIDPVVGLVVTIGLGLAGFSYWALVIGAVAGLWSAAIAAVLASPYRLRLRFEALAIREYASFSWPLLVAGGSGMVAIQVAVLVGERTVGLAGLGAIGLAGTIAMLADRVDQIVMQTLYPAICAVKDRRDLLFESFTKSNRLALIWGVPFGVGLTLFAPDLVRYVLGARWEVATGLLQVFGGVVAVKQIGFSWVGYHRALGQTRPLAVYGVVGLVVFLAACVPGMLLWGLTGYAVAIVAMTAVQLVMRAHYLRQLFSAFDMARHSARALAPVVPSVAAVLALRLLEAGRTGPLVVAELSIYVLVTLFATWIAERDLLREMFGYLRRRPSSGATDALGLG